ncbi:MAG: hypothetical protein ACQKBY_11670 [Verrucomicrobiales bacterium]
MKLIVPLVLCSLVSVVMGAKVPRGAFSPAQLEEARAQAKAEGKLLVYIETDTESSCPKCQWATDEAFDELKRDYVMVVEDGARGDETNQEMLWAINEQRKGGNFTPCITVVEPTKLKFVAGTDYKAMAKEKRWNRKFEESVEAGKAKLGPVAEEKEAPKKEEAKSAEMSGDLKSWTNTQGQTIRAALVRVDVDQVYLRMEDGKLVAYPLAKLTPESRQQAMDR